jgi:hypothetical protein
MDAAYLQSRFLAQLPASGLPAEFILVTAQNPASTQATADFNAAANEKLRAVLDAKQLVHFPVSGSSAIFPEPEEGFGVVCGLQQGVELGIQFGQEGIWWISEGDVFLVDCKSGSTERAGRWDAMSEPVLP